MHPWSTVHRFIFACGVVVLFVVLSSSAVVGGGGFFSWLSWSPNGERIAVFADRLTWYGYCCDENVPPSEVFIADAVGKKLSSLESSINGDTQFWWSPSGNAFFLRREVYARDCPVGKIASRSSVRLSHSMDRLQHTSTDGCPAVTPAVFSANGETLQTLELFRTDPQVWGEDEDEVAVVTYTFDETGVIELWNWVGDEIVIVPFSSLGLQAILDTSYYPPVMVFPSPDGTQLALASLQGERQMLSIVKIDGSDRRDLLELD